MTQAPAQLRRAAAIIGLGLAAVSLSACVTVFPKTKPVQLYHLGLEAERGPQAASGAGVSVLQGAIQFNREVAGDRLLTRQRNQAAYVAQARWTMQIGRASCRERV